MKVLLISANTERSHMVTLPLGAGLVAEATRRAGHEVTFLDLLAADAPRQALSEVLASTRPEVIGISIRNIDDQNRQEPHFLLEEAKWVVAGCRSASAAPIVLGGAGFSIFPREVLAYLKADFGIRGDGERAFPILLECLSNRSDPRSVPGVYTFGDETDRGRAEVDDLDELALWDATILENRRDNPERLWLPIQSRRGCPNDCSYCSTSAIQGRRIRCRSSALVADELAALERRGFHRFYFVDNSFNLPESQAFSLCREIKARHLAITWRCILYPHLMSEELVNAMAEAGCSEVSLGFESGSARVLAEMNKRFRPEDVRRSSELLAAYGIRRMGFLLLGGPGETRDTVQESLAFAHSLQLDELKITVGIRIYPGTPLARRAVQEGLLAPEESLLKPAFYLAPGLEPWIHEAVRA
jgi:radical SAM superfamily enzyme YgiQ (UPF0313 family)